jgi:hypothetical protein
VEVWSEKACLPGQVDPEGAAARHHFEVETVAADRWYALFVRSRHEKTVENSLRSKRYNVFSPSYRTKRKRVDRIAEIDVPLFPGYVFCQFDPTKRLPILTTPHVVGVVGRGNRPESGSATLMLFSNDQRLREIPQIRHDEILQPVVPTTTETPVYLS